MLNYYSIYSLTPLTCATFRVCSFLKVHFMNTLSLNNLQNLLVWLAVFLSPTGYVILLITIDKSLPEGFVIFLFCFIPFVALLACMVGVWYSKVRLGWRMIGLVLTMLAMLLQCSIWFFIFTAIVMAIAPAQ